MSVGDVAPTYNSPANARACREANGGVGRGCIPDGRGIRDRHGLDWCQCRGTGDRNERFGGGGFEVVRRGCHPDLQFSGERARLKGGEQGVEFIQVGAQAGFLLFDGLDDGGEMVLEIRGWKRNG